MLRCHGRAIVESTLRGTVSWMTSSVARALALRYEARGAVLEEGPDAHAINLNSSNT